MSFGSKRFGSSRVPHAIHKTCLWRPCGTIRTESVNGLPYGLHIRRTVHNPPRGLSAGWCVLTTANVAGTNGLTCLTKHDRGRDNKFLVTHPKTDQRWSSGRRAPLIKFFIHARWFRVLLTFKNVLFTYIKSSMYKHDVTVTRFSRFLFLFW
jgi:hypothetical protein